MPAARSKFSMREIETMVIDQQRLRGLEKTKKSKSHGDAVANGYNFL